MVAIQILVDSTHCVQGPPGDLLGAQRGGRPRGGAALPLPDHPLPGPPAGPRGQGPVRVPGVVVDQLRQDRAACGGLAAGR